MEGNNASDRAGTGVYRDPGSPEGCMFGPGLMLGISCIQCRGCAHRLGQACRRSWAQDRHRCRPRQNMSVTSCLIGAMETSSGSQGLGWTNCPEPSRGRLSRYRRGGFCLGRGKQDKTRTETDIRRRLPDGLCSPEALQALVRNAAAHEYLCVVSAVRFFRDAMQKAPQARGLRHCFPPGLFSRGQSCIATTFD